MCQCAMFKLCAMIFHIITTTLFLTLKAFEDCFLCCNVSNGNKCAIVQFCHMLIPDKDAAKHSRLGQTNVKVEVIEIPKLRQW